MYILHIETATANCSLALSKGKTLLECHDMTEGMNHTALLAPAIDLVLKKFSLKPGDLSAISVSAGPGSYTGLRVGSSTAKAMAYSLDIPLLAIPTLYSLAKAFFSIHPEARFVIPMLDARRLEVYTALYDVELNELQPPYSAILDSPGFMGNLPSAKTIYAVGDGAGKIERIPSLASRSRLGV